MSKNLNVVIWDIETSHSLMAVFGLYPEAIPYESILQEWYIITACWKTLDGKKIYTTSVTDDKERFQANHTDDYHVVKTLRDMLEDVDVLIHHNGDRFDLKKLTSRLIYHNLPPLPKLLTIDTLKEVRKIAAFTSNKLDYLSQHLNGQGKIHTEKGLWLKVLAGDPDAVRKMAEYCRGDVQVLEDLYIRIRPYLKIHPNLATPDTHNCPKCNSNNVVKDGTRLRASGARFQTYKCKDCGANYADTKTLVKPLSKV